MKCASVALLIAVFFGQANCLSQDTSREDFNDFCRLISGRWIGSITWAADWPGFGKRGDKVTTYFDSKMEADGSLLHGSFQGGEGTGIWLLTYDAGAKQIKGMWVTSAGTVQQLMLTKKDGKWTEHSKGNLADGRPVEGISVLTVSEDGDLHTWAGSGKVDGKPIDDHRDVWRRVYDPGEPKK